MAYNNLLNPWCIIRQLPNNHSLCIVRFRRRSDAEDHLQILQRKNPTASYEITFDIASYQSNLMAQHLFPYRRELEIERV
jgi:hypothetical protein